MRYGVPYQGSKNSIAAKIISFFAACRKVLRPICGWVCNDPRRIGQR